MISENNYLIISVVEQNKNNNNTVISKQNREKQSAYIYFCLSSFLESAELQFCIDIINNI